ncbi:hypothetical protein BGX26_008118, partial [Mortierella sp. AD094]
FTWENTSSGYYLVAGSADKSVRRWKIIEEGDELKAILCWSSSHAALTLKFAELQALNPTWCFDFGI